MLFSERRCFQTAENTESVKNQFAITETRGVFEQVKIGGFILIHLERACFGLWLIERGILINVGECLFPFKAYIKRIYI